MLSRYEINGSIAYLYITVKGSSTEYVTKIDTEELDPLLQMGAKWYVCLTNGFRVWGYFKDDDTKYKLLYRVITNAPRNVTVDHINNDPLDNRKANLRLVTQAENNQNYDGPNANNKVGVRGVSYVASRNKYTVRIRIPGGSYKSMGYFDTIEEASIVAFEAKKQYQPFSKEACSSIN